uniref:Uncharacterized protein n=1 Tax=Hordeum vulgare subsp. vulgare TaxID=112509 RepID=A0A8I6XZT9_HORVV
MGIYITRWSAKRLREIANTVKGKERDVVSKSSFGDLLHISPLPPPPEALVDFIVMRIDTKKRLLNMGIYITRWSAKRLREIANTVKGKKRDVVSKSSFGDLLHISPLPPPPEALVDFIVMRIDTKKRLLKLTDRKKISLTRDFVKKIFNVPSGSRPLEFGKRGKSDFREIYLEGERAPIPTTVSVLSNADDDDEDTIDRTWILLCLSLVLAPGTGNMVPLEYLHSLQDMSVVHEFEWDEHILLDAMREVKKYQDKRNEGKLKFHIGGCLPMLPVIYMHHTDIPRGCIVDHSIDYSLPRACFVKELDFTAVIAVDTMEDGFGKRPFSSTTPYATTKFLSYIEQVAELPNIASVSATENPVNRDADGAEQPTEGGTNEADGRARNVHEPPPKNMQGGDDVCGSLEDWLHPLPTFEDSEDVPQVKSPPMSPAVDIESFMEIREGSPKFDNLFAAATSPGPVYDVTPLARIPPISTGPAEACIDDIREEAQVEVSSGRGHDQKHPTLKRAAPTEPTAAKFPKMKKKKIDAMDDAIYQRYCCTNYKIKDPPRGEPLPSFIRVGGFDISFKHFSNGLKKRAHVNNEVMSLYIESFNIEHMYNSSKPRKFAFSPHVTTKLSVDPSSFNPNSCTKDFKRACEKNDNAKSDQDTTSLLNFRKYIAAKLFKHPQNTLSSEEELQKLLKKS